MTSQYQHSLLESPRQPRVVPSIPRIKGFFFVFFILSILFITDARANSVPEDKFSLEKRQADVFRKMLKDPTNMDYMFDYALISIELSDLEGAITTLQRMLISNPNLPRVHMELGAAFFKLGSYNSAASSFKQVKATDDVPAEGVRGRRRAREREREHREEGARGCVGAP